MVNETFINQNIINIDTELLVAGKKNNIWYWI